MNLLIEGIEKGYVIKTELVKKVTIDGNTEAHQVYKVRLDCLYYNDQNDRIATWISQYKADNNVDNLDMKDIESYNNIIQDFIYKSNPEAIKKTQTNIGLVDQREPGLVLADGRIIDGNRRFTCLRNLTKETPRFNYFETIILEKKIENAAREIKMLELMIQRGEESKVDYNPIDRLVGIYNDLIENKLLTVDDYVRSTNATEQEVNKNKELATLLVEFLETINAPKQFYIARDMNLNGPLVELHGILKKINDDGKKDEVKNVVFTNFLMQPEGDMTRFIRKFKTVANNAKCLDSLLDKQLEIAEKVLDKLPPVGKVNKRIINDIFRSDEEIKEELERSLNRAEQQAKSIEKRNQPSKILEKTVDSIEDIDINIFKKLDDEQLTAITTQLDRLEELLGKIRKATNV